jgi:hypothetical protein
MKLTCLSPIQYRFIKTQSKEFIPKLSGMMLCQLIRILKEQMESFSLNEIKKYDYEFWD